MMRRGLGDTVGVGVWGLGRHARHKILPSLAACTATDLVGLTTRDEAVARTESDHYGCQAWPDPEQMLSDPNVDVVYVATPTGLHHRHGVQVLQAGKHLWCEKAIAETFHEAHELVQISRDCDRSVCEALMYLHHPHFAAIRQLVTDGSLGEVLSLRSQFGIPHLERPGFRLDRSLGGGALLDVAPYPISAALALLGPDLELIHSFLGRGPGVQVDTHGWALLSTRRGAGVYLEWGYERAYRNEISIWGEEGSLHSEFVFSKALDHTALITLRDAHGVPKSVNVEPADSFSLMFHAFADAVHDPIRREAFRGEILVTADFLERVREGSE